MKLAHTPLGNIVGFYCSQLNHVRLVAVTLLMLFGFPFLQQQDVVVVLQRYIIVIEDAALLSADLFSNAGLGHSLEECLPFAGDAAVYDVDAVRFHKFSSVLCIIPAFCVY